MEAPRGVRAPVPQRVREGRQRAPLRAPVRLQLAPKVAVAVGVVHRDDGVDQPLLPPGLYVLEGTEVDVTVGLLSTQGSNGSGNVETKVFFIERTKRLTIKALYGVSNIVRNTGGSGHGDKCNESAEYGLRI